MESVLSALGVGASRMSRIAAPSFAPIAAGSACSVMVSASSACIAAGPGMGAATAHRPRRASARVCLAWSVLQKFRNIIAIVFLKNIYIRILKDPSYSNIDYDPCRKYYLRNFDLRNCLVSCVGASCVQFYMWSIGSDGSGRHFVSSSRQVYLPVLHP